MVEREQERKRIEAEKDKQRAEKDKQRAAQMRANERDLKQKCRLEEIQIQKDRRESLEVAERAERENQERIEANEYAALLEAEVEALEKEVAEMRLIRDKEVEIMKNTSQEYDTTLALANEEAMARVTVTKQLKECYAATEQACFLLTCAEARAGLKSNDSETREVAAATAADHAALIQAESYISARQTSVTSSDTHSLPPKTSEVLEDGVLLAAAANVERLIEEVSRLEDGSARETALIDLEIADEHLDYIKRSDSSMTPERPVVNKPQHYPKGPADLVCQPRRARKDAGGLMRSLFSTDPRCS